MEEQVAAGFFRALPELLCVWQGFGCFGTAGAGMERRDENAAVSF